ncbi:hypothetical protein QJS10_CPB22g00637 [Acorus calamus]|uniref:Uncharacterized protein n=1 Tax=Acorus calamus TaxID=4465 RepID=A0AAV9BYI7_ACOCL|nr:hypothetical protein QJS10_CPB22g00637 [Acorus calamus]
MVEELKFLPKPSPNSPPSPPQPPTLDLHLSISFRSPQPPPSSPPLQIEALRRQASEQMRLAEAEKAYAGRVRELAKREAAAAEAEFEKARAVWEAAREAAERVEWVKEKASRRTSSACIEITCHACRQRFRL